MLFRHSLYLALLNGTVDHITWTILTGSSNKMSAIDSECYEKINLFLRAYSLPKIGTFRFVKTRSFCILPQAHNVTFAPECFTALNAMPLRWSFESTLTTDSSVLRATRWVTLWPQLVHQHNAVPYGLRTSVLWAPTCWWWPSSPHPTKRDIVSLDNNIHMHTHRRWQWIMWIPSGAPPSLWTTISRLCKRYCTTDCSFNHCM